LSTKISIPTPRKVNGNSKGEGGGGGGILKPNFLKESMTLKWNFWRGGVGVQAEKPSVGGVWIFSGTTQ